MKRVENKRVVLTGAVSNIGLAAVEALLAEGARVVVGDINRAAGEALAARHPDGLRFVPCDVTDEGSVASFVDEAASWLGGMDAFCQNAGIQLAGLVTDFTAADWEKTFRINVLSQFLGAKYAVPHLRAAGGGSIVNMASAAGLRGGPGSTVYSASKGAVISFSKTLAMELANDRIRVNVICPGWIDTPFNDRAVALLGGREAQRRSVETFVPLKRQGTPGEIAPMFVYLVSDESSYVTGQALVLDGGINT